MDSEKKEAYQPKISAAISMGKDIVSFLRDGALFILSVLLIAFPNKINSILTNAGFKKGSVVGFEWEASIDNSIEALTKANAKISELQKENNEQAIILAEAKSQSANPILKERISQLEKNNKSQNNSTIQVLYSVDQAIKTNTNFLEKTTAKRPNSDYLVGLQTLGFPDAEREAINSKLSSNGYGLDRLTASYSAGDRPSWFATRSTVFYYSASALPAAQELARYLKTLTKQEFVIQRGAGLGVDPSQRDITLFVHFVKE
jgi:hypothetical protein